MKLPDEGSGNQVPYYGGVSLVVIYRDPNPAAALKSIVIYDGGHTMDQSTEGMTQTIQGFYQASTVEPLAKMTHIVGDGQSNFLERVLFNGHVIAGPGSSAPAPFSGALGRVRGTTLTFSNLSLPGGASQATVTVDHGTFTPFDCLSWDAILFSTDGTGHGFGRPPRHVGVVGESDRPEWRAAARTSRPWEPTRCQGRVLRDRLHDDASE